MPLGPDRRAAIGGGLIDVCIAAKGGLGVSRIQRDIGREGIEPAATHERDLIDQHVSHGAQFAGVAGLAQDPGRRIAAPVAEYGEVHFDQPDPVEVRQEVARVVTRLQPDGGGIGLLAKGIDGDAGIGHRFVITKAELDFSHKSPP